MLHNDPKSKIPEMGPILDWGILDFGFRILGGSGGCATRQFRDGALRSEARIPPGPSPGSGAEPTGWGKGGSLVVETGGKGSKAYIFPCFLGFYVQVWTISVRYLIQLGEKENWATETRQGGRDNVGNPSPNCIRYGCPGNLPGSAATGASLF